MTKLKNLKKLWLLVPAIVLFQGCPGGYGYKYNTGSFPVNPVNFTEMNTKYDDYNMSAPTLGESVPLCFSTNRNSMGENFDFIYKPFSIVFSKTTGELNIGAESEVWGEWFLENATLYNGVRKANSPNNELGPFLIPFDFVVTEDYDRYYSYFLLYSNDENGSQDIRFTHNTMNKDWEEPLAVDFLNSNADDAYPTFNGNRWAEGEWTEPLNFGTGINTEYDEYRPIVRPQWDFTNDFMLFSSNRPGGLGGFDLYFVGIGDIGYPN